MATKDDSDIPESGAVFTFGKSKFADNQPNKFWVKNDKVLQIACGDEHTALITESGRVFMFGPNDWGQLGLGNDNKVSNKPSCIKSLKHDKSRLVACGRSHTIVSTVSGHVYSFGSNSEGQLGIKDTTGLSTPKRIESLPEEEFKMLEAGSDSSVALTEDGRVYVWGGNEDGKLGLGKVENAEEPVLLAMERPAVCVACGYYHTAIVSDDGKLYTMGESENGKLGLPEDLESTNVPQHVADITEPVKWVACGSSHTVALTESGDVYVFGDGDSGQLGLGTDVLSCNKPTLLKLPFKVAHVFCGQSFTACISEKGQLYTFGDGRHGKLAHGSDIFSNQYKPFHSKRFTKFLVDKVACGGCHMIVTGRPKALNGVDEGDNDGADEMKKTLISQPVVSSGSPSLTRTLSARERRRDEVSRSFSSEMNQTLPPPGQSRILPSLSATMPALKSSPKPVIDDVMENGFVPKLQNGKLSDADSAHDDTEDEEHASEKHKKRTKLPRPKASPRRLPQSSQQESLRPPISPRSGLTPRSLDSKPGRLAPLKKDDKDDGSKANTGSGSDGDMENEEDTTDGGERKKRKKKRKPSRTEEEPQNEEKEKAEDSWNDDDGSDLEDKKENKAVKELESALVERDGGKTDEEKEDEDGDSMIGEEKAEKDEEDVKKKEQEGDEKNGKESDDESKGPVPIPRKQKAEDSEDNEEEDKESSDKKDSAVDLRPESDKEEEEEEVEKESKLDKDLSSDQEDDKKSKKDKKEKDKKKKKDEEEEEEIKEEVKEKSKEEDDEEEDEKDSKKKGKDKKKDKKDKKKEKDKDKKKKKGKGEDEEEEKEGEEEEKEKSEEKSDKKSKDKKKDKKDKKKGKDKDDKEDEEEEEEEDEEDDGKGDKKKKDKDKKDKDKKKKKGKEDEKEKDENGNNEKPPPKKSRTCTIL